MLYLVPYEKQYTYCNYQNSLFRTNPCEMSTVDLERKYRCVASIDDMKTILKGDPTVENVVKVMKDEHSNFYKLWSDTFVESNKFESGNGLAPRCTKLGMVTGAVLHCILALEQSVVMRKMSERALKIIRVESSKNGHRLVGMRYPIDDAAIINLRTAMQMLNEARRGTSNDRLDEKPGSIQPKSVAWLSNKPKTMKSYFKMSAPKRKESSLPGRITPVQSKRGRIESTMKPTKSKAISTFFIKK